MGSKKSLIARYASLGLADLRVWVYLFKVDTLVGGTRERLIARYAALGHAVLGRGEGLGPRCFGKRRGFGVFAQGRQNSSRIEGNINKGMSEQDIVEMGLDTRMLWWERTRYVSLGLAVWGRRGFGYLLKVDALVGTTRTDLIQPDLRWATLFLAVNVICAIRYSLASRVAFYVRFAPCRLICQRQLYECIWMWTFKRKNRLGPSRLHVSIFGYLFKLDHQDCTLAFLGICSR